jgi:hypothetical protein
MVLRDARFRTELCSADRDHVACRSEEVSFDALVAVTLDHIKEDTTMRYMTIVKGPENAGVPPKELFDAIDKLLAVGRCVDLAEQLRRCRNLVKIV